MKLCPCIMQLPGTQYCYYLWLSPVTSFFNTQILPAYGDSTPDLGGYKSEQWLCDYNDTLDMAEQSLNDLLVAEFKEAFDQFDKVCRDYKIKVIKDSELAGWKWNHFQQGVTWGDEVHGAEPHRG